MKIALIVGDSTSLLANDIRYRDFLYHYNHDVTIKDDNDSSYDPTQFDSIVIVESINSSSVAWLKTKNVGILFSETSCNDEFSLSSSSTASGGNKNFVIKQKNFIVDAYDFNAIINISNVASPSLGYLTGFSNDVIMIAHHNTSPTYGSIVICEKNDKLIDSTLASNRRCFFAAYAISHLNDAGRELLHRALLWTASKDKILYTNN